MAKSSESVVVAVRLSREKAAAIERLAASTDRSKQWLLERAVDAFLLTQAWQIEAIEEGIAAAEAGETVPHDQVREWLLTWGKEDERKPPV